MILALSKWIDNNLLLNRGASIVTHQITDRVTLVPLDYAKPNDEKIEIFTREIAEPHSQDKAICVFLMGGPGHPAPRNWQDNDWIKELAKHYRVILLDQRGTGRSQRVDINSPIMQKTPEDLAEYLSFFRADSIVCDIEYLRTNIFKKDKIYILGQSYGGFIAIAYLSIAPEGLAGAYITCGMPPININSVDDIYTPLLNKIFLRNQFFYKRFPQHIDTVKRICGILHEQPLKFAAGLYTAERFLDLGWCLGMEDGDIKLKQILDDAFIDSSKQTLSWGFLNIAAQSISQWETNPIYTLLHEPIYCNNIKSDWSADRVKAQNGNFAATAQQPCFSGEMIRHGMFKEYPGLVPFAQAAEILAQKVWGNIYSSQQLQKNTVPVVMLICKDDFYIDYGSSLETAALIKNTNLWIDDHYQHDAIRKHGKQVISTLITKMTGSK